MPFIPQRQGKAGYIYSTNLTHHLNKFKDRNHIIISISSESLLDNAHHIFMMKVLETLGRDGTSINVIKAPYNQPIANTLLNEDKLRAVPLKPRMR